jgi:hypothetical protein
VDNAEIEQLKADLADDTALYERGRAAGKAAVPKALALLRAGVGPSEVIRLSPFSDAYIRKLARRAGIPPARQTGFAKPAPDVAPPSRRPADFESYAERRPYTVADRLDDLTGPTTGVVELPHRMDWSGNSTYNLDSPARLATMYKTVLAEASTTDDLNTWLNKARLLELWPDLWLPPKIRKLWTERFPELAATPTPERQGTASTP